MNFLSARCPICPRRLPALAAAALFLTTAPAAIGGEWPTYMGDNARRGVSTDALELTVSPRWIFKAPLPPSPGFAPSVKADTMGPQKILAQPVTFDYAFAPVIAEGRVYFGSSSQDCLWCLDLTSGRIVWQFFAEGAIRLTPTVADRKVYFGSDDSRVYCLSADDGRLLWRFVAAPERRRIIANGRIASQWPVRTGVTIAKGRAYFAAGLFPASGEVYFHALDAATGTPIWKQSILLPPQGYILPLPDVLLLPNGRASPAEYLPDTGKPVAARTDLRREGGGGYVAMMDDMVVYGPNEYGILRFRVSPASSDEANPRRPTARAIRGALTGLAGRRVTTVDGTAFLLREDALLALPLEDLSSILRESASHYAQRSTQRIIATKSGVQQTTDREAEKQLAAHITWQKPVENGRSLIVAERFVVVGAENRLLAWEAATGRVALDVEVEGTVWELAAAGGVLLASTDTGRVYAFGRGASSGAAPLPVPIDPFADDRQASFAQAAEMALKHVDTRRGFCLVLGLEEGRLAREIATQSEFRVLCLETDRDRADAARRNLLQSGLLGRVSIHVLPEADLPYLPFFANLIVSESLLTRGRIDFGAGEVFQLLQPYGGAMVLGGGRDSVADTWGRGLAGWARSRRVEGRRWDVLTRGPLEGAGQWDHMFANAANTASSGDTRVRGTRFRLQWFGDPGPNRNVGWHANGMGPLYREGVLFAIKHDYVEAIDAYNGTFLWSRDMPGAARMSPGREGGAACVDNQFLYMAVANDCRALDVRNGKEARRFVVPGGKGDWGFLAVSDGTLFGSRQKLKATLWAPDRRSPKALWNSSEAEWAVSELLFALDPVNGRQRWTYGQDGNRAIVNSTITIAAGMVFLVESRDADDFGHPDGSLLLRDVMDRDVWLIALNAETGKPIWQRPLKFPTRTMLYLSHGNRTLVLSGAFHAGPLADAPATTDAASVVERQFGPEDALRRVQETKIHFTFRAFSADDGRDKWNCTYASEAFFAAQHNYNVSHPVVLEDEVWHAPAQQSLARMDLKTGELQRFRHIRRAKGCATPTGSARNLFYRSLGTASFDTASGEQFYVSRVSRPSCWLSILPAGGLVLMPEYSIGCNCAFPLQTSVVLTPQTAP
jgi:outer membrane protein assembly factor BamB